MAAEILFKRDYAGAREGKISFKKIVAYSPTALPNSSSDCGLDNAGTPKTKEKLDLSSYQNQRFLL